MHKASVLSQLQQKYPGKTVICLPEDEPTEILCEIEPAAEHYEYSLAVAVIDFTAPHFHTKITETYTVLRGELVLRCNGTTLHLTTGQSYIIEPNQIHSATGTATWVMCKSEPGWTKDDHHLV